MADFQTILNDINTGGAAFAQVLPTVSADGIGSIQSISSIVAAAGATVASTTKDQTVQAETIAATQTALTFLPLIFSFFHRKAKAAQTPAP